VVPPLNKHLENNLNWLTLMREEEPRLAGKFRGIVLTGWQRYDHFAVLCELLPAGLPSLAVNLLATSHGYFNDSLKAPLLKELSCPEDNHNSEDMEANISTSTTIRTSSTSSHGATSPGRGSTRCFRT